MTYTDAAKTLARADNFKPADEALSADVLAWWNSTHPRQWVSPGFRGGVAGVCDLGEYERRLLKYSAALKEALQ